MTSGHPDPRDLLRIGLSEEADFLEGNSSQAGRWEVPSLDSLKNQIPGVEVLSLLGRGGMAAVYRVQNSDGSTSAIKLLPAALAANPIFEKRFAGEINILTSLNHPRLIQVHRHGKTRDGQPFYVMDDMTGGDVGGALKIEPTQAVFLVAQVCEGLAYLHDQGLLHRDLKPSNLLLNEDSSEVRIADFGLAKQNAIELSQMSLTRTGTQVGTLHYLAPELYSNSRAESVQSDLYSLGVILYQLLTGRLPMGHFQKVSEFEGVPRSADAFMMKALAADPASRFSSAQEFAKEMHLAFLVRPLLSRRTILAGGLTCLVGSGIAWRLNRPVPLVPGVTLTSIFERPITRPWTSPVLWPGVSPEQMKLNHFIAGEEAHLIHFTPKESSPHVPGFEENHFPGQSLTLQTTSSIILAGYPGDTRIDHLILDGGTVTSDLVRMISPEDYPELNLALGDLTGSTGVLTGEIEIRQTSTFTTGLAGKNRLIIDSSISGDSPIFMAPPRRGVGVDFSGDNSNFSGGWYVQGDLVFASEHAGGTGNAIIDWGSLRVASPCQLGDIKVLDNAILCILAPTILRSLIVNGKQIPPGKYQRADDLEITNIQGEFPLTIQEVNDNEFPEIYLPRITVLEAPPLVVTARQSGRWDRQETWDGPMPIRARHAKDGLTIPPIDYIVPKDITVRGTFDPRGLEFFGGRSLTLEPGSMFEPEGNIGFMVFPELRLAGGVVNFSQRHSLFARELIGGRLLILAPTLFRLPDQPHLQPKDLVLQGKIIGSHSIRILGDREEYVFLNADTSEFSGEWEIEEGTLALLQNHLLKDASIHLKQGNCWLRCINEGITPVRRLRLSEDSRIEPKKATLQIEEMWINDERIPDGIYNHQSLEMRRTLLEGSHNLIVGKPESARK